MIKKFRTRQNRRSLFPDFRPGNGMISCRKWDGFWRMGEWASGASGRNGETAIGRWGPEVCGVATARHVLCATAAAASSRRD
jgi:hypothetical protein